LVVTLADVAWIPRRYAVVLLEEAGRAQSSETLPAVTALIRADGALALTGGGLVAGAADAAAGSTVADRQTPTVVTTRTRQRFASMHEASTGACAVRHPMV
jgi:hypothetical protein